MAPSKTAPTTERVVSMKFINLAQKHYKYQIEMQFQNHTRSRQLTLETKIKTRIYQYMEGNVCHQTEKYFSFCQYSRFSQLWLQRGHWLVSLDV